MSILQMIKQAFISFVTDDSTAYPQGQATYNGKTSEFTRLSPYGLCSNPPQGALILLFSSQGQESVKFGISDLMPDRFKNLKSGEVVLYNYLSRSFVYIKENGDIEVNSQADLLANVASNVTLSCGGNLSANVSGTTTVDSAGNVTVTAPQLTLNGNLQVNGNITSSGTVTAPTVSGTTNVMFAGISGNSHVHPDPDGGNTGGPINP